MNTIRKNIEPNFDQEEEIQLQQQEQVLKQQGKAFLLFRPFTQDYTLLFNHMYFIVFIFSLCTIYIWNGHYANKVIRDITKLMKDNVELEYKDKMLQSEWYNQTQPSKIIERLKPLGFKELNAPPYSLKIVNVMNTKK